MRPKRNAPRFATSAALAGAVCVVAGVSGRAGTPAEPPADCSKAAIVHYAVNAPSAFEPNKRGLLYGVETHTPETRVWKMPGYNSCALVAHAILKKAGCGWAKYTADAKMIYAMAEAAGWRSTETQTGGCLVAWNARWKGSRARLGPDRARKGGIWFRHVGITTGAWTSVDNTGVLSRPMASFTLRPIQYEKPIFLCPVEAADKAQQASAK
jgi:hypothetical protein